MELPLNPLFFQHWLLAHQSTGLTGADSCLHGPVGDGNKGVKAEGEAAGGGEQG